MVKAKQLKQIRKTLDKANTVVDPLAELVLASSSSSSSSSSRPPPLVLQWTASTTTSTPSFLPKHNVDAAPTGGAAARDADAGRVEHENDETTTIIQYSIEYRSSKDLSPATLRRCASLFADNMTELYQNSSFASQLPNKVDELAHPKARYLLVRATTTANAAAVTTTGSAATITEQDDDTTLVAYAHFRFEVDDDDHPTCAALYLYELQVVQTPPDHARRGIGTRLVQVLEHIGQHQHLDRIVLTVLHNNVTAKSFYLDRMGFTVDANSPSQHGELVDYEILSKSL